MIIKIIVLNSKNEGQNNIFSPNWKKLEDQILVEILH